MLCYVNLRTFCALKKRLFGEYLVGEGYIWKHKLKDNDYTDSKSTTDKLFCSTLAFVKMMNFFNELNRTVCFYDSIAI